MPVRTSEPDRLVAQRRDAFTQVAQTRDASVGGLVGNDTVFAAFDVLHPCQNAGGVNLRRGEHPSRGRSDNMLQAGQAGGEHAPACTPALLPSRP